MGDQWKDREEWSWATSDEETERPRRVRLEVDQHRRRCPGECRDDQTDSNIRPSRNVADFQSDVTDGQSLRPLVGHRARWRKRWQKHSESGGREVNSILNQRTFEPGEDPEKRSCDILRKHQEVHLAHWSWKAQRRLPQMSGEDNARYWICRTAHPGRVQYRSDARSSTMS